MNMHNPDEPGFVLACAIVVALTIVLMLFLV